MGPWLYHSGEDIAYTDADLGGWRPPSKFGAAIAVLGTAEVCPQMDQTDMSAGMCLQTNTKSAKSMTLSLGPDPHCQLLLSM